MSQGTVRFDLLTLQLFVAAVEEQSIAQAAERNHIAVSAVSRRISDLEVSLQVDLLHRHAKGIEPTPAGYVLLEHARIVLGSLVQMEADMLGFRQGTRGYIRLHVNTSATLEGLADQLGAFLRANPLVKIDVEESISPAIIQAVAENRADIGIFGGNVTAPELETFLYREDNLVAIVAAGHELAGRERVRFTDLIEHEFVSLEKGSSIETVCVSAAASLGRHLKLRIRVGGFEAMFSMVAAHMGVGIVPREVVAPRVGRLGLIIVPLDEPWTVRPLLLGVRSRQSLAPAARQLLDFLTHDGPAQAVSAQASRTATRVC